MKSLCSIPAFCMLFFFFSACSKKSDSPSPPQGTRLTRYTEILNPRTFYSVTTSYDISYDQNNKVASIVNSNDPGSKFMFDYVSDGYNFDIYGSGNVLIHRKVMFSGNTIDSTIEYNNEGDTTTEKYIYWAGGILKFLLKYDVTPSGPQLSNVTEYTYGLNNMLVSEKDYHSSTVYSYDRQEVSNFSLYPIYVNRSKQLPSLVSFSEGNGIVTSEHTYTFDAEKRLIKDEIVLSTGQTMEKAFKYE